MQHEDTVYCSIVEGLIAGETDLAICRRHGIMPSEIEAAVERLRSEAETCDAARLRLERLKASRASASVRATERRLQALMDITPEAILVVEGTSGRIVKANPHATEMFGYAHEAFIGRSVEDLVPHSYRRVHPAYRIGFLTSTRKREMGYHPPIFALRADGKEIEIKVALTASPDDDTVMAVCRQFAEWDALKADNPEDAAPQRRPERG